MGKQTLKKAALAVCHRCLGFWSDGVVDCEDYKCPLYYWQIRADKSKADLEWMKYNPKRVVLVTWEESKKELTDEQRKEIGKRFRVVKETGVNLIEESLFDEDDDVL